MGTYSTFLAHSGGLLSVMKAQLVRMVNMINMLNIVETKSRNTSVNPVLVHAMYDTLQPNLAAKQSKLTFPRL